MRIRFSLTHLAFTAFAVFAGGCLCYYWSLNCKPFTQNAFVISSSRVVSPLVDGYITEIPVKNGQFVRKGEPLLYTYSPPYALRVAELESAVAKVNAQLVKLEFQLETARAEVRRDRAVHENRRYLARQAIAMYATNAISQTYTEEAVRGSEAATAQLDAASGSVRVLESEKKVLEADRKQLEAQLALARIWLEQTVVYALTDGFVTNMYVEPGAYQKAGDKLFALVPSDRWKVQANFEETALSLIRPGQKASVWLWQYPGKRFQGVVESVDYSVERRKTSGESSIQIVEKENQWFLLPQRLPVEIRILNPDPAYPFHLGASAYVQIHVSSQLVRQIIWRFYRWN